LSHLFIAPFYPADDAIIIKSPQSGIILYIFYILCQVQQGEDADRLPMAQTAGKGSLDSLPSRGGDALLAREGGHFISAQLKIGQFYTKKQ
jgi:hypothetical protein